MGTNPSPYLSSKVTLPRLLISFHLVLNYLLFGEARNKCPLYQDIYFCQHLIRCSVQDLYLNKVILSLSDYIFVFNEMGTEKPRIRKPRNMLCKQPMIKRRHCIMHQFILLLRERLNNLRTAALSFDTAT